MKSIFRRLAALLALALLPSAIDSAHAAVEQDGRFLFYVGTYTGAKSKGIYAYQFDSASGEISPVGLVAETPNPTFLAIHPTQKFLYAANEIENFGGNKAGAVSAFAIDQSTGALKPLNQASTAGPGPCHLVVDRTGRAVLAVNYGGGSVASFPLNKDGSLLEHATFIQHTGSSVNPQRQKEPHAHSINLDPANRFAFVADLGLDKVFSYRLNPVKATLTPNDPPFTTIAPGSGPRHFTFHPDGRHAYLINEMLCTLITFDYDATRGALKEKQTVSTLPPGVAVKPEYSTAEVVAHPNGKFLYGSNRGHDSIAVFSVAPRDRTLTWVENVSTEGRTPRNFALDPTGKFLLAENQSTHSIVVFRIDQATGKLTPTGQKLEIGSPVCIKFVRMK